jgi:hypothetical protein
MHVGLVVAETGCDLLPVELCLFGGVSCAEPSGCRLLFVFGEEFGFLGGVGEEEVNKRCDNDGRSTLYGKD